MMFFHDSVVRRPRYTCPALPVCQSLPLSLSLRAMRPISLIHLPIMSVTQSTTTMHGGDVQLRILPNIEVEHCHSNLQMRNFLQEAKRNCFLTTSTKFIYHMCYWKQGCRAEVGEVLSKLRTRGKTMLVHLLFAAAQPLGLNTSCKFYELLRWTQN